MHCLLWFIFLKYFKPPVAATHTLEQVCHVILIVSMCSIKYYIMFFLISRWAFYFAKNNTLYILLISPFSCI